MPKGRRPGPTGSVIGRAFRVLDAFSTRRPTLSLSEIARRSKLPLSTVHRLLTELSAWGAVERGEDGLFRIGLRLWEVGALAPRGQGRVRR